eukprot:15367053-Ditylum_brightwellii.AAC.1
MDAKKEEGNCKEAVLSKKVAKLSVDIEVEFFQNTREVMCNEDSKDADPNGIFLSVDSIILHSGLVVKKYLKAWELDGIPKPVSKYTAELVFVDNSVKSALIQIIGNTKNLVPQKPSG